MDRDEQLDNQTLRNIKGTLEGALARITGRITKASLDLSYSQNRKGYGCMTAHKLEEK